MRGCYLTSKYDGDKYCSSEFGSGWEMASHNEGVYQPGMDSSNYFYGTWTFPTARGGWNWWAHNQLNSNTRFWVHIAD